MTDLIKKHEFLSSMQKSLNSRGQEAFYEILDLVWENGFITGQKEQHKSEKMLRLEQKIKELA